MGLMHRSLWRHRDFMYLWSGQTISLLGSAVTGIALPLAAVRNLHATALEMGLFGVSRTLPALLFALLAGVWVDRMRRRPVLIGADLGRAALLGSIPALALFHLLSMTQLYVVAFLVGILTVFFDVAYYSFLPTLVASDQLPDGNSKLETSRSVVSIAGPGIAGALVQLLSASIAITADALSFLGSVALLSLIRAAEAPPARPAHRRSTWREMGEGLQMVMRVSPLRTVALLFATYNVASNALVAVYFLYVTQVLHLAPVTLGLIFAAVGPGFLLGSLSVRWLNRRWGIGPVIAGGAVTSSLAALLVPLAVSSPLVSPLLLGGAQFFAACGNMIVSINQLSIRQAVTPDRMLGRVMRPCAFSP